MTGNWPERFRQKVTISAPGECWEWAAAKSAHGYGAMLWEGRFQLAHRLAWQWAHERAIPAGMIICHRCDNPPCVNPAHLFLGSAADNAADMVAKGGQAAGRRVNTAKLGPDQVAAIRADGRTQRVIAAEYGVAQTQVGRIKRRENWRAP